MDPEVKREIIMENYLHPYNKEEVTDDSYLKVNTNNESCIDNIDLYVLFEEDKIKDIKFNGEACAISTSATSIMIQLLIGKTIEEAIEPGLTSWVLEPDWKTSHSVLKQSCSPRELS